ncbi:MAG: class I SAM-dependent methyltransferase [Chlamydiae bacterium]|nr:class I SAM-dependent methyltransferase [Chlamydiota bacterium]
MISEQSLLSGSRTHHSLYPGIEEAVENLKDGFISRNDFSHITREEVVAILDDLASFPLGRHILLSGGSNGMWTDYLISPQEYFTGKSLVDLDLSVIERFFLFNSPTVLAQRELYIKLKKNAQKLIANGKIFASLPCGLMRDLLSLDYSGIDDISLIGIDIDRDSLNRSEILSRELDIDRVNVKYIQEDAWNLQYKDSFDFISSIGLNMYERDEEKVVQFYRNLFDALKPGGTLFTGVLTWPPYLDSRKSNWEVNAIPKYDMYLETVLHRDILNIQWFNFRTLAEIKDDFRKAGFSNIRIEPDSRCIFPAIIAVK